MQVTNPLRETDPRIDAIYHLIKGSVNWSNLVPACIEAATELEQFTQMKGADKLDTLQKALRLALRDSDMDATRKEEILHTIDTIVPIVVQAAIMASKSPILAQVQSTCMTCWKMV